MEAVERWSSSSMSNRWLILGLFALTSFVSFSCYDLPEVLHGPLVDQINGQEKDFSLLYSIYVIPNIIFPVIGGVLVDISASHFVPTWFCLLVACGMILQYLGCIMGSFALFVLGRFIFGLGVESLLVVSQSILAHEFSCNFMAFALALNLSAARLGNISTYLFVPTLCDMLGVSGTFLLGNFMCIVTLFISIVICLNLRSKSSEYSDSDDIELGYRNQSSSSDLQNNGIMSYLPKVQIRSTSRVSGRNLGLLFCIGFLVYGAVTPFTNIARDVLLDRYFPHTNDEALEVQFQSSATQMQLMPSVIAAALSPLLGYAIDRYGHRTLLITLAPAFVSVSYLLFITGQYGPYVPLVLLGLSYSVFSSVLWSCVPLLVNEKSFGISFGLLTGLQNLSQTVISAAIRLIYDECCNYTFPLMLFSVFSALGVVIGGLLWYNDEKFNQSFLRLNASDAHNVDMLYNACDMSSDVSVVNEESPLLGGKVSRGSSYSSENSDKLSNASSCDKTKKKLAPAEPLLIGQPKISEPVSASPSPVNPGASINSDVDGSLPGSLDLSLPKNTLFPKRVESKSEEKFSKDQRKELHYAATPIHGWSFSSLADRIFGEGEGNVSTTEQSASVGASPISTPSSSWIGTSLLSSKIGSQDSNLDASPSRVGSLERPLSSRFLDFFRPSKHDEKQVYYSYKVAPEFLGADSIDIRKYAMMNALVFNKSFDTFGKLKTANPASIPSSPGEKRTDEIGGLSQENFRKVRAKLRASGFIEHSVVEVSENKRQNDVGKSPISVPLKRRNALAF